MQQRAFALICAVLPALVASTDDVISDPLSDDPDFVVEHLYKGQWPVGIAVSSTGRKFSSFACSSDELNTNNGTNGVFQVAELDSFDTEKAYPDESTNNPPGGCVDFSGSTPRSKGLSNYFLSVSSVIFDKNDYLYALDSARCRFNGVLTEASTGGPKLVKIDINSNSIIQTFVFPENVASPLSNLLDVAVDTDRNVAYVSDGSPEGINALVVLRMDTGESYRRLEYDPTVTAGYGFVPFVWGDSLYQLQVSPSGEPIGAIFSTTGVDGVTLSPNEDTLYWKVFSSRFLYSVSTALLLDRNASASEVSSAVRNLGENGFSGGIASGRNGTVYGGQGENDGIFSYDPESGLVVLKVHDPRISFVDRLALAVGKLFAVINQFNYLPVVYRGKGPFAFIDEREKPYALFSYPVGDEASEPRN